MALLGFAGELMTFVGPPKYLVFDTETGGVDPFNDRIVQLFIATADALGNLLETWEWVINPGVEIAEEAASVHGYTTERLAKEGVPPANALEEARNVFVRNRGLTWVAYNLVFDLTFLDVEFERNLGVSTFGTWAKDNAKLADALVIDRRKDKYRKGGRKLMNLADHYGVPYDEDKLHDAAVDVELTAKVTVKVLDKYGTPSTSEQSMWYTKWAQGFEDYKRQSDPKFEMDGKEWPLRKG